MATGRAADTSGPATRPAMGPAAAGGTPVIGVEEFDRLRAEPGAVVLDVRTPQEFAAGHVPGAINVPVTNPGDFDRAVAALPKDKPVLVHCARGGRAAAAVARMEPLGFARLADFAGGMEAWRKANKPVEAGDGGKPGPGPVTRPAGDAGGK